MGVKDLGLNPRKMFAWASDATSRIMRASKRATQQTTTPHPERGAKPSRQAGQKPLVRRHRRRRRPARRMSVLVLSAFLLISSLPLLTRCEQQRQQARDSETTIKATRAILGERPTNGNNKTPRLSVRSSLQQDKRLLDLRWPGRQLNVLVDKRSLNDTEHAILASVFKQIERKTCVHVHRLSELEVNPFASSSLNTEPLNETERHFIYVFKSSGRNGDLIFGRHPSMGLSSLGCVKQGRQSLVLTEPAFKWPELVLRYHVMRSLGVDNLERPDGQIRRLLNMLPLNQKIASAELLATLETQPQPIKPAAAADSETSSTPSLFERWSSSSSGFEPPTLVASSGSNKNKQTRPSDARLANVHAYDLIRGAPFSVRSMSARAQPVSYLSEDDLEKIKELYDCKDYQNKLSPIPLDTYELNPGAESIPSGTTSELLHGKQFGADAGANMADLNPKRFKLNDETPSHTADGSLSGPLKGMESESISSDQSPGLSQEAAQRIVDSLLNNLDELRPSEKPDHQLTTESAAMGESSGECKPLESCPLEADTRGAHHDGATQYDQHGERLQQHEQQQPQERPMILKLDEYHAHDPQLKQANQMKLSQLSNDTLETYRLMNNPVNLADFLLPPPQPDAHQHQHQQQQQQQQQQHQHQLTQHQEQQQVDVAQNGNPWQKPRSEMLISFEQSNSQHGDPVSALASSQVLKLCSCTCQTMTPKAPATLPPMDTTMTTTTTTPTKTSAAATTTTPESVPETTVPATTPEPAATLNPTPSERPTFPTDVGPPKCDDYDGDYEENGGCHSPATPTASSVTEPPPATSTAGPTSTEPVTLEPITSAPTETLTTTSTTTTPAPTTTTATTTTTAAATTTTTTETITTTTTATTTTTTPEPVSSQEPETPASITEEHTEIISTISMDNSTTLTTTTSADSGGSLFTANACNLVEWVRPNKTIYNSPRIVWDVDRANQNYFLCNNQLNGELIPGKTHGFYCKISHEGKSFEAHNFSVLTKPEHVNLAWVQKNSNSFGRTNFPVVGGYSKQQDPYIVSRCLVKDENNDIITLIGYINNQGVGWFPFDDIQIECSQYDVLACVN